jgi:hypothetical protein
MSSLFKKITLRLIWFCRFLWGIPQSSAQFRKSNAKFSGATNGPSPWILQNTTQLNRGWNILKSARVLKY